MHLILILYQNCKYFKYDVIPKFRYYFTHNSTNDHTYPFSTNDFEAIKNRTLRDVICDNMKEFMPMVAKNPFLTYSEENTLENCNPISNMRARDLSFFDGERPSGVSIPQKEGIIVLI